jgi:hypothetical protein
MDDQTIEPPNDAEAEWVRTNVMGVREAAGGEASPAQIDELYAGWFEEWTAKPEEDREDPNPMINAFGLAFGQVLVDELGLDWAVVTDKYGTEIAVHGQPGDLLVFPPNLVAKRFERGETHFLQPIYQEIAAQVAERRGS